MQKLPSLGNYASSEYTSSAACLVLSGSVAMFRRSRSNAQTEILLSFPGHHVDMETEFLSLNYGQYCLCKTTKCRKRVYVIKFEAHDRPRGRKKKETGFDSVCLHATQFDENHLFWIIISSMT